MAEYRFFYDYTFPGKKWQLFTEIKLLNLTLGKKQCKMQMGSQLRVALPIIALNLTPGVFLSYFPSSKFTVLALGQHTFSATWI